MISALQREDISWDEQTNIANRLLVFGSTSMSLMHLIHREMARAKVEYEGEGESEKEVTIEVRKRLISALSYVFYGISQYDSSVLANYVTLIDDEEKSGGAWLPNKVLLPEDFEQVKTNVEYMTKKIEEQKIKENLTPLSQFDVPKAALHEFENRLAFLYLNYEKPMNDTRLLPLTIGPSIDKSECVERFLSIYSSR